MCEPLKLARTGHLVYWDIVRVGRYQRTAEYQESRTEVPWLGSHLMTKRSQTPRDGLSHLLIIKQGALPPK